MLPPALPAPNDVRAQSAAQHAVQSIPIVSPEASVAEIVEVLRSRSFESVDDIAVCTGAQLVGLLNISRVLSAPPAMLAHQLMDADPPIVAPGVDQEVAAWKAVQHGESSLAVVDADGRFVGLVPPRRLLAVLLQEHDEDMARLGGFLHDAESARTASQEPIMRRLWHRLPWLIVGLAGAFVAASVVGRFEGELQDNVILAFFMPGIVYMADAVGTQTETLVIRGLSVGIGIRQVVFQEVATGLVMGMALALVFFPIGLLLWGEADVALAVSLSLFAASSAATTIAMALPFLIHRFGGDPAFGSGPLATVIQDILSIALYLEISVAIVN